MHAINRFFLTIFFAIIPLLAISADEPYPASPVSMIVPFPPGGASDLNARLINESLSNALKQPVIILNKPGLGGAIGSAQVAKAKPDGYTTIMALSALMVHPEAERVSGRKPLYEIDQFEPIALISSDPMIILVKSDSPWKNLNDLIQAAKQKPGAINYASSGIFGPIHLSVEMLAFQAGIKLTGIPFNGGGPAMLALLGGQVDFTTAAPGVAAAQIASGKVRPLAVSSGKRIPSFPDIPTYKDAGYDAEYYIWAGIYVPKGTPSTITNKLRESVKQAVQTPQFTSGAQKQHIIFDYRDAPEFKKFAEEDGARMLKLIRTIGKVD